MYAQETSLLDHYKDKNRLMGMTQTRPYTTLAQHRTCSVTLINVLPSRFYIHRASFTFTASAVSVCPPVPNSQPIGKPETDR